MTTRLRILALAAFAFVLMTAGTSSALQKTARVVTDFPNDDWSRGADCTIQYYNTCTGWLWVWSGFASGDRVGQFSTSCCSSGQSAAVLQTQIFWATGAPTGYSFTGTVDLWAADANGCPTGPSLGSQPMLPTSGNVIADFTSSPVIVPNDFVVTYTFGPSNFPDPSAFGTEHPAAGPTGPQACGTCYPVDRVNRSFYYASAASPLCPGSSFNDGVCDSQLMWILSAACVTPVSSTSWGQIKNLYR